MKRTNLYFLIVSIFIGISSCSKDKGYYNPPILNKDFQGSIYDYLKSKPGVYDSLLIAVDRLGLESTLRDSNVTLFALTNPSFQLAITNLNNLYALSEKPLEYIRTVDYDQLDTMVTQYIIKGSYPADSLRHQDGLALQGVKYKYPMHAKVIKSTSSGYIEGGPELIQLSDTKRSQFTRDWIGTSTASINIQTGNGVVHVISPDHVFGFEDFITRLTFNPPPPNLFKLYGGTYTVSRESGGGPNGVEGSMNSIDGNPETKFLVGWNPSNVTLTFELSEAVIAGAYTITSANDAPDRDPADWNLQGSVDGETWIALDSKSNQAFEERFQQKVFFFPNTIAYKFYRLNITRNNGSDGMQFADWTVNFRK